MAFELVAAQPEHVPEIGRICYEAFKEVSETHGFESDLPTLELAQQVLGMLVQSEGFYGVVALQEGRPVGSNFLSVRWASAFPGPLQRGDCRRA